MKLALKTLFRLSMLLLFTSCTVYKEIPIEVMRMREIILPNDAKTGMLYRNFKYDNDTLQNYYISDFIPKPDKNNKDINIDSIAVMTCLSAFTNSLESGNAIKNIRLFPYHTIGRTVGKRFSPLPANEVQKLSKAQNLDIVIALETFSYMYSEFSHRVAEQNSCEVTMAGIWAIYNGETGKLLKHESAVDTLFWNISNEKGKKIKLPPRIPAIEIAAATFAENYAKKFVDDWEIVSREMIIPPPADFAQAAKYAEKNQWSAAAEIWQKYTPDKYGKLAIVSRYNMALAAEMSDNIPEALQWLQGATKQALSLKSKNDILQINRYNTILQKRLASIEAADNLELP
ncbi:MAG: DUF6340 family protein [Prolixibacteraceae bacterium]|nr:DUF6340 family protein [Prolixibacteraceae bacterium]